MQNTILDNIEKTTETNDNSPNINASSTTGNITIGNNNQVTHHNYSKFDDSAIKQGRHKISIRQMGNITNPMHMTPKEYKNYSSGLWDGIERLDNRFNYEPWDFNKKGLLYPEDRRNSGMEDEEHAYSKGYKRRAEDKKNEKFFYTMLITMISIIMFFVLGSVIQSGALS